MVDLDRSASTATTSLFSRPSSTSARPKASRVEAPSLISNLVLAAALDSGMSVQLLQGQLHLVRGRRHAVEFGIVLHERDALPFYGVGHNTRWLALSSRGLRKCALDGREIVTIDFERVPAE